MRSGRFTILAMKRNLLLAASVMTGLAIAVSPSARAEQCTDGDTKYLASTGQSFTCVGGAFREDANPNTNATTTRGRVECNSDGQPVYSTRVGSPANPGPANAGPANPAPANPPADKGKGPVEPAPAGATGPSDLPDDNYMIACINVHVDY